MVLPLKPRSYIYLSLALFCVGMVFYGIYNEILIIRLPFKRVGSPVEQSSSTRKMMKLTYWNGHSFTTEEKELLFSEDTIKTTGNLITSWLSIQEEEHPGKQATAGESTPQKVTLQSVMLDASGRELFISFDRSPLPKEASTLEKLLRIEGLLKTIKETGLPIQFIRFLVYAHPLQDSHLDFSHSWPIAGYSAA